MYCRRRQPWASPNGAVSRGNWKKIKMLTMISENGNAYVDLPNSESCSPSFHERSVGLSEGGVLRTSKARKSYVPVAARLMRCIIGDTL